MNHNALAVTGTPTLTTGALTVDTDQALAFNGTTNSASATDSTSLSITGSMSIELFVYLSSLPGSTKDIVRKTGSYAVQVNSSGNVLFVVTGPSSNVTVTSNVTLSTGRWYHLVCVYNGNYSGTPRFGLTSTGSSTLTIDDDTGSNTGVTQATLSEQGILTSVSMALQYFDEIWPVSMNAVVYSDTSSLPGALVTQSPVSTLNVPTPAHRVPTWVTFPLEPVLVPAGTYYLGYQSDTIAGTLNKLALKIGMNPTGGLTALKNAAVGSPPNPFGTAASSTANVISAYCDYSPTSRSGDEGKAIIYINGAKNVSAAYAGGIADTANSLDVCPALAASVDEISIWDKALSPVQIATHYTAH